VTKVICLIDTRNHARFIDECVQSCLAQEVPAGCDYAVHVVDAGSTDGTRERLETRGQRITLHARDNVGQSGAFDLCLDLDAEIFMFCDGDDRLAPSRLRRVLEVFAARTDVVLVGNSITEIDETGQAMREVFVDNDQYLDARAEPDAARLYAVRALLGTSRLAVRKTALVRLLPFERVVLFEADELLFNLVPALGTVCVLSERLTEYRLHSGNSYQTANLSPEQAARYRVVHEALLACMSAIRGRAKLGGPYVVMAENGLRTLCEDLATYEKALRSRREALRVLAHAPKVLGFVDPSRSKRLVISLTLLALGLERTMAALGKVRRFRRRRRVERVCLL
jgi:glycosyltransferase involved in cell wall biosynthesis